ncbi:hypothetical protein [Spiroplasma endosymbiont of Aspidapion aeneum]|uniref:hypothetical protein n=1 Tax=Spiroplasma endosymbiont of Aspidapion aeneum TaxID=3066276 RepID=UPI00313D387C
MINNNPGFLILFSTYNKTNADFTYKKLNYDENQPIKHENHYLFIKTNKILLADLYNTSNQKLSEKFLKMCKCEGECNITCLYKPNKNKNVPLDVNLSDLPETDIFPIYFD